MSRSGERRNLLRYPLDVILGSEACVRLLRVLLHETETPISAPAAARLAGITQAGARRALQRLESSGLVERIGTGRGQQYRVKDRDAYGNALGSLFDEEERRYQDLISSLKRVIGDVPEIRSAWIDRFPEDRRGSIDILVIVESAAIEWIGEELRTRIAGVEREHDLTIETTVCTRADAVTAGPEAVFLLASGPEKAPLDRVAASSLQSHADVEKRSLAAAQGIAELIGTDPSLIERAKQHLDRLLREGQGTATADVAEWRQLLETYSADRVRSLLVSDSSRAARLRQSAPFFAVLTPDERDHLQSWMVQVR